MLYPKALLGRFPWEGPQLLLTLCAVRDHGAAWSVHKCVSVCVFGEGLVQGVIRCLTVEQCSWLLALLSNDMQWLRVWGWWLGLQCCLHTWQAAVKLSKASSGSHNLCINDRGICAEGAKEALTPSLPQISPFPNEMHSSASFLTTLHSCYWLPRGSKNPPSLFSQKRQKWMWEKERHRETESQRGQETWL